MLSDPIVAVSVAGLGAAVAVGGVAYIYYRVAGFIPFLYPNTILAARSSYEVSEKRQAELAALHSVKELVVALQNTDYGDAVKHAHNLLSFQAALEKGFVGSVTELKKLCPKSVHKLLDAYLMFWEARIVKAFYRQKFSGADLMGGMTGEMLFETPGVDNLLIKRLGECRTIADMGLAMAETPYARVFEPEYAAIEDFEVALDGFVLKNFVNVVRGTKIHDAKIIAKIFNMKFDIMNLLVLMKARVRKVNPAKVKALLIDNGSELYRMAGQLAAAESMEEFVEKCRSLEYYTALAVALSAYHRDKSLIHFEKELYSYYKSFVKDNEFAHQQSPYAVFAYLVRKEVECRNLMVVANGVDNGIAPEKTRELLL